MSKIIAVRVLDSKVIAVAVEGAVGDWSAYIGSVAGKNHEAEIEKVAEEGTKLHRDLAKFLFKEEVGKLRWRG